MRKLVAIALALVPLALHAEVGVRQASEADLAIALYDAAAASIPVAVGDDVYVSFVVANNGPAVARDVHVRFVADPRWISPVGLFTCHDLDCSIGDLEPGQKADVRFHAKAPATPGTLTVEASVASSTDDRNPGNNVARAALAVVMWPELFIDSIKQDPQYQAEGRGSFDVRFGNKGTASATNVEVKIDFPEGSKVLSAVAGDGVNCDAVGETVTCRIPILPPSRDTVTIHTRFVNPPLYDGGTVQAEVQISGAEQEIYTANNTARTHWRIPQFFAVTNTADSGPGSLREAILAANAACRAPCTVGFRIPGPLPEAGFFTVRPSTVSHR